MNYLKIYLVINYLAYLCARLTFTIAFVPMIAAAIAGCVAIKPKPIII